MNPRIAPLLFKPTDSIKDVMRGVSAASRKKCPTGIALIVEPNGELAGIATDGDFRRAVVKGIDPGSPISSIMIPDPVTAPEGSSEEEILATALKKVRAVGRIHDFKVDQVVIVDPKGCPVNVLDFFDVWGALDARNRTVAVLGLGFVGLTFAAVLADAGFRVIGLDKNEESIAGIKNGKIQFFEKGLESLVKFHTGRKNFTVTTSWEETQADIYIITVGTPIGPNHQPELGSLTDVALQVGKKLKPGDLVLLRSTVPVGTTRKLVIPILEKHSSLEAGVGFHVAFAPERTIEGNAIEELRSLPQVVGGLNRKSADAAARFFSALDNTIVRVQSLEAAEVVKLINNCFRDVSFAFSNEIAQLCDRFDLNAHKIIEAANEGYPRNRIPTPSPGVGGACLTKDSYLFSASFPERDTLLSLHARNVNESMPQFLVDKIFRHPFLQDTTKKYKIFIIGFAFKGEPETSDMRGSTTLDLLSLLKKKSHLELYGYDPVINKQEIERQEITACTLQEGFQKADVTIIMNNHRSYRDLDLLAYLELMNKPGLFVDTWSLFPKIEIERIEGIRYEGLSGRN